MKVGIAIDEWKLPIFERHLSQAGYAYTTKRLGRNGLLLTVETDDAAALGVVVENANRTARAN